MGSKLNVKLKPLEVRLPSVELLLKKYGKYLVHKRNPGNPICDAAVEEAQADRQGRLLENPSVKEDAQELHGEHPIFGADQDPSSDSDGDYPANPAKESPKLVIGYKLLQNKKLKRNNKPLDGECHKQNAAAPKQEAITGTSKSVLNKHSSGSCKALEGRETNKSSEPFEEKLKHSSESKGKSRDEKLIQIPESGAQKSAHPGFQFSTQMNSKKCEINEPHSSASKSSQKFYDGKVFNKKSEVRSKVSEVMNFEPDYKSSSNDSTLSTSKLSKNNNPPAANGYMSSKEAFKMVGGLNNNFSLKFKELKIVLHRIDDKSPASETAPEIGGQSLGEDFVNQDRKKDSKKDHTRIILDSSTVLPPVQAETLAGTKALTTSPVFQDKLSSVTLILYQTCKCDCGLDFSTKELLLSHSLEFHSGTTPGKGPIYKVKCNFCDIRFNRWSSRKKHEHQFHSISKPAPSIDTDSNAITLVGRPVTTAVIKLTCELCGEVFVNQSNLSLHHAYTHASDALFQCQICKEKFKSQDLLQMHSKVHIQQSKSSSTQNVQTSLSQFQKCSKCDLRFKTVIQLKLHDKQKHSSHPCNTCAASYSTKAQLNRHIKVEHNQTHHGLQKCNDQSQRKRSGPASKVGAKKQKFCVVQPFRADLSGNNFNPSLGENPVKVCDEPVLVECDSYASSSIHFNETDEDCMDDPLEDPLADPLLLPDTEGAFETRGHEGTQEGSLLHSQIIPCVSDKQPSLLALLEGADPNDPNYYIGNGEGTVTLNYMPPENIKCPHCSKTFNDQVQLKQHSQIHSARIKKPYICLFPDCSERFDSSVNLRRHRQEAHERNVRKQLRPQDNPVPVNEDFRPEEPSIPEHLGEEATGAVQGKGTASNSEIFACKICGEKFDKVAAFVKHEWSHAGDLTCKYCPARFENMLSMERHISRHKGVGLPLHVKNTNSLPVPITPVSVTETEDKTEVESKSKLIKSFQCHYCKSTCKTLTRYTRHMATHRESNPNGKYKYKCQYCWKKFNNCSRFTVHVYNHSKPASIRCRVCPKTFKSMIELTEHRKTHVNIYSCSYCYKKFDRKNTFEAHLVMHSKEKLFSCQFCSETFYRKQTLLIHIRRLHNKKHSQANSTSQTFSPTKNLQSLEFSERYEMAKTVVEKLNGEIPTASNELITGKFPCRYCAERFDQRKALKQHNEIHRIHRCTMCPKKYLEISHLCLHLRMAHTGMFEFRCEQCDKSFDKMRLLRQHYATKNHLIRMEEFNKQQTSTFTSHDFRNENNQEHDPTNTMLFLDDESASPISQEEYGTAYPLPRTEVTENESAGAMLDSTEDHAPLQIEPSVTYACHQCSGVFTSGEDLGVHFRQIHVLNSDSDRVVSLCRPCNRVFMSLQEFKEHTTAVHGQPHPEYSTPLSEESSSFNQSGSCQLNTDTDRSIFHTSSEDPEELRNCTLGMTCWTCGAMLPGIISLSAHMSAHHGTYTCPYDGSTFVSESELLSHFRQHTAKNPCRCKICKPNTVSALSNNQNSVHSAPAAGASIISAQEEDDEVTIIENVDISSTDADEDDDITILEERINIPSVQREKEKNKSKPSTASTSSTSQKSFAPILNKCVSCRQDFSSREVYEAHICVADEADPGLALDNRNHPFHCPMCPRTFIHQETLVEHVNLHKHLRGLVSKLNWGESSQLRRQNQTINNTVNDSANKRTPPPAIRQSEPEPEILSGSENLNSTLMVADNLSQTESTDIQNYCEKCYKKFKTSDELKSHTENYQHRADHSCPVCRMAFSYKDFLDHMSTNHPGEKIYSCSNICQIHFRTVRALNRHMQTTQHTSRVRMHELYIAQQLRSGKSVLDFECPKCHTGFSSEELVVDHMVNSDEYSTISNPSCQLKSTNSISTGGAAIPPTTTTSSFSPTIMNPPVANQEKSRTWNGGSAWEGPQTNKPSRVSSSYLNLNPDVLDGDTDDIANNPEDEQETDVIWSNTENDEDEQDDTPVFQIVTHAPL